MYESGTSTKSKSQAMVLLSNKASALGGPDTTGYPLRDQQSKTQPITINHHNRAADEGEEEKDQPARKRVKSKNEMGGGKVFGELNEYRGCQGCHTEGDIVGQLQCGEDIYYQ